jgi:hypothetical protein
MPILAPGASPASPPPDTDGLSEGVVSPSPSSGPRADRGAQADAGPPDPQDADRIDPLFVGMLAAYRAGQRAKSRGSYRAVPDVYLGHARLEQAWIAGWRCERFPLV